MGRRKALGAAGIEPGPGAGCGPGRASGWLLLARELLHKVSQLGITETGDFRFGANERTDIRSGTRPRMTPTHRSSRKLAAELGEGRSGRPEAAEVPGASKLSCATCGATFMRLN